MNAGLPRITSVQRMYMFPLIWGLIPTILFNHRSFQKPRVFAGILEVFKKEGSLERMGKVPLESSGFNTACLQMIRVGWFLLDFPLKQPKEARPAEVAGRGPPHPLWQMGRGGLMGWLV